MSLASELPIGKFTDDHATSYTLPSSWYFEPDVYRLERDNIFHRSWRVVCHKSALAKSGDYATTDIHGQGVLVVRGFDGVLRAFYNVCQHRAHELLRGSGTIGPVITCPYHAWAYGLDGNLRAARRSERVRNFDKRDFSLVPVRVQEFSGFVFVNLDTDAPPMHEWAPGFEAECRKWFPDLENVVYAEQTDFPVEANWKVVVENAVEGYHFPNSGPVHRQLCDIIDLDRTRIEVHPNWFAIIAPPGPNKTDVYPFPDVSGHGQTDHFITLYLWPDWIIYSWPHADMISTFLMRATGPESSVVENGYFRVPGSGDDSITRASEEWFNTGLGPEDASLNIGVQRGVRSRGYTQGRFVTQDGEPGYSEHCVHEFQKWVRDALVGQV